MPLVVILREILELAKTRTEAKKIISQGKIVVDGRIRSDERFPVGLMDVVSIPETKKDYRLLPSEKGLLLHPINDDEAKFKICRIENKKTVDSGHIQLNLHDGRNVLIRVENPQDASEDVYQVFDVLKIGLPNQELLEHLKPGKGMFTLLVGGKNIGKSGLIASLEDRPEQKRRDALVAINDETGQMFQTTLDYAFVIGDAKSRILLPKKEGQ